MADTLAASLVAALADLTVIEKGRTATIPTKAGGKYSYGYADLADVVKVTRPVLAEHGLVALTPVHAHGDGLACTVTLIHVSGEEKVFDPFPFPHGIDAQATGSMVTYHRRYALVAALGLAIGDDDDDGAAAKAREPVQDDYTPGLRSSVEAAIAKLDDDGKARLKEFFAEHDLPAVRKCNSDQLSALIDHLMSLPDAPLEEATP